MIIVKQVRYGLPCPENWVACCLTDESRATDAEFGDAVADLDSGDYVYAYVAAEFIENNCHFAGGATPAEAVANLFKDGPLCNGMCE